MASVRAHRFRLALLCAALAVAGGAPAARAVYAEVSARAVATARAEAQSAVVTPLDAAPTPSLPPLVRALPRPVAPTLVVAPLYLSHCSLLL
jgi:hypothetical protein